MSDGDATMVDHIDHGAMCRDERARPHVHVGQKGDTFSFRIARLRRAGGQPRSR